jgi:hypothetical protein
MTDIRMGTASNPVLREAQELERAGDFRAAIDVLTQTNRRDPDSTLERALVHLRREGGRATPVHAPASRPAITASGAGGTLVEVDAGDLDADAVREAFAACGCLLVRGLVPPERASHLAAGMDAALAAYDAAQDGKEPDPGWYDPRSMPDREASAMPEAVHRAFLRGRGSMWTADSPRMLFELFELVDDLGLGDLMTDLLGERPLLSGIKGTMRRVPPDVEVDGRWHQDGAFLGEQVNALNIWITLSQCGQDAPGLDIVPKRVDGVITRDADARFDWSLSEAAVLEAGTVVRPLLEAGDAVLFDQLLIHRTGASPGMTRDRYAIESWFFGPSAYPADQLPILY